MEKYYILEKSKIKAIIELHKAVIETGLLVEENKGSIATFKTIMEKFPSIDEGDVIHDIATLCDMYYKRID